MNLSVRVFFLSISTLAFCFIALAATALAGPPQVSFKHAPVELIRDRNGNPVVSTVGQLESSNWSGYILAHFQTDEKYTSIQGTWTVPSITYAGVQAVSAEWVGIGGFCKTAKCNKEKDVDKTLIQLGTAEESLGISNVQYFAWYEVLPKASVPISMPVNPGDVMTVSLTCAGNCKGKANWTFSFMDETSGQSFSKNIKYKSPLLSAEWIEEAPTGSRGIFPLADYGTASFSASMVNGDIADLNDGDSIVMQDPSGQSSNVSAPSISQDAFNTCFSPSSALTPCAIP
jgi:hypothetical protein